MKIRGVIDMLRERVYMFYMHSLKQCILTYTQAHTHTLMHTLTHASTHQLTLQHIIEGLCVGRIFAVLVPLIVKERYIMTSLGSQNFPFHTQRVIVHRNLMVAIHTCTQTPQVDTLSNVFKHTGAPV